MTTDLCIIIPMTTKGIIANSIEELPLFKYFVPSFLRTIPVGLDYQMLIGMDDDDPWVNQVKKHVTSSLSGNVIEIKGCKGKPAWIWNMLSEEAYKIKPDYLLQVGDDVEILDSGWWQCFTQVLIDNDFLGVTGFYDEKMTWREQAGLPVIIENSLVHRTHFEIFNYYFSWEFPNWYCDDWLTSTYKTICCFQDKQFRSINHVRDNRYDPMLIAKSDLLDSITISVEQIYNYKSWNI